MMKNKFTLYLVLLTLSVSFHSPLDAAITTTLATTGEDIVWSIQGIPDSKIQFLNHDSSADIYYYRAPLRMGVTTQIDVDIPEATPLPGSGSQRRLRVSIPDAGTRWVAQKEWFASDGTPAPTTVELKHRSKFSPYQRNPAYPDSRFQPDKNIMIEDATFSIDTGMRMSHIFILPEALIGLDNSLNNGLPIYAKTEPDSKTKKPYGCNGCSEMGLPGYRVNMANLMPVIQDTLFQWGGRGPSVSLALTWNARQAEGHTNFGTGWRFSYDSWLKETAEGVIIEQDNGGQLHFNIPLTANNNITYIPPVVNGDREIIVEYTPPAVVPSYKPEWDGEFTPDRSGYRLKKNTEGDPLIRTFTLSPPDQKLSYIFQGPSGTTDLIPLIAIEDWNGNRVQITRNAADAITQITDAVGRSATLSYNPTGQCTSLTIPGGQQLSFNFSGSELIQTVDLISNKSDYTYNGDKYITEMNTEGRSWLFDWTTTENITHLSSVTNPSKKSTQYAISIFDFAHRQTRITDATGRSFTYNYSNGIYRSNTRQQSPTIVYDATGRPSAVYKQSSTRDPRTFEYDDDGNLTRFTEYDTGVHTYTYNEKGQVTQYTDALDNIWLTEFDAFGNETRNQSPAGRVQQNEYDAFGQHIQSTDPMGNSIQWTYDSFGNVQTSTNAEGAATTYSYDSNGFELTNVTNALGQTTSFSYDANRRPIRTTYPDGTYKETLYDCCAAIGVRNENGDIRTLTRSPSLKVLTESDYLGNTVSNTYDASGRQTKSVDPEGRATISSYNSLGQISSVQNAIGDTVTWIYQSNGNQLYSHTLSQEPLAEIRTHMQWWGGLTRANNMATGLDKMGRLNRIMPFFDYERILDFSRDADGLLTEKSSNINSTVTSLATFTRDANGSLTSTTHPLGTDTYQRNGRKQVTRKTWYDTKIADFNYGITGRLASLEYPDGSLAVYTYDSRGRTTNIAWKGQTLQTQYDGVGNIIRETRSNGITSDVSSDKNSRPIRIHHHTATGSLFDLQCSRNANGLITTCSKSGTASSWTPILTAENTNTQYKYDHSFTIDTRNGQSASTDVNGNQTTIPGSRGFTGTFDFQNLLISWDANTISNTAIYDGQNRLIQWTRGSVIRKFHYDSQDRLLFETDENDTITAMWLYRGKQIVAMTDNNGLYFYHNDLSANVTFLSDEAGEIVATYRYLPFGLQTESVSTVRNPFTFVGSYGVLDLGDSLYYMRSRTYDAMTQAFLSNDPLGMGVTTNAREYANNNPINWMDPDGRSSCQAGYSLDGVAESYQFSADQTGEPYVKKPYYSRRPQSGQWSADSMKCATTTLANVAGANKAYGSSAGAYQIANKLRQGNYVDAAFDAGASAIGKAHPIAGAMTMFMGANQCGEKDDAAEAALIQKFKNDPNSYYNKHSKKSPSYGDFTIPPFTLDD